MSSVTVVFVSGSATIHAVQASRYVPRCKGVTGAGRSDHRSMRFGIGVCVVLCDALTTLKLMKKIAFSMLCDYGTMENWDTYRVSVFGSYTSTHRIFS